MARCSVNQIYQTISYKKASFDTPKIYLDDTENKFFVILSLILCCFYKDFSTWLKSFSFIIPWNLICVFWYIFDIFEYQTVFFIIISIDCRCCDFFKFSSSGSFVKDQVEIYSGNIRRSIPKIFIKIMFQCGFSHYMFEATYLHVTFFERCRETLGTLARVRFIY